MDNYTCAARAVYDETSAALQLIYNELNQGQQQKLLKNAVVKALLDHYGVCYD